MHFVLNLPCALMWGDFSSPIGLRVLYRYIVGAHLFLAPHFLALYGLFVSLFLHGPAVYCFQIVSERTYHHLLHCINNTGMHTNGNRKGSANLWKEIYLKSGPWRFLDFYLGLIRSEANGDNQGLSSLLTCSLDRRILFTLYLTGCRTLTQTPTLSWDNSSQVHWNSDLSFWNLSFTDRKGRKTTVDIRRCSNDTCVPPASLWVV